MVATRDHQLHVRHFVRNGLEGFNQHVRPFVGTPLSKCHNPVFRIATAGEIRVLRICCQSAVRAEVDITATVFVQQDIAVSGHQHGKRIRQEQHFRRDRSCHAIQTRKADPRAFQVDEVHQVMQGHVCVIACHTRECRKRQSAKSC
jgi:hypothetical protein